MLRTYLILVLVLACLALLTPPAARAQSGTGLSMPEREMAVVYSFVAASTPLSDAHPRLSGARFSAACYTLGYFALVADTGFYRQSRIPSNGLNVNIFTYEFGGRFRTKPIYGITPFVQGLVGGGYASGTLYTHSLRNDGTPLGANKAHLFSAGAGFDWRINEKMAIRVIQI